MGWSKGDGTAYSLKEGPGLVRLVHRPWALFREAVRCSLVAGKNLVELFGQFEIHLFGSGRRVQDFWVVYRR